MSFRPRYMILKLFRNEPPEVSRLTEIANIFLSDTPCIRRFQSDVYWHIYLNIKYFSSINQLGEGRLKVGSYTIILNANSITEIAEKSIQYINLKSDITN